MIGIVYGAVVAMMQTRHQETGRLFFRQPSWVSSCSGSAPSTCRECRAASIKCSTMACPLARCFSMVGMIYDRRHTRMIAEFGGLWKQMPMFSALLAGGDLFLHRAAGAQRLRR